MKDNNQIVLLDQKLIDGVLEIIKKASVAVMGVYAGSFDVEYKDDKSPVTKADILAHDIIFEGLQKLTPEFPIVSEEGDLSNISKIMMRNKPYWLVDPIDGTKDFINHTGQFTICIALINNFKPEIGFLAAPAISNEMYYGGKSYGSYIYTDQQVKLMPNKNQKQYIFTGGVNQATQEFIENNYSNYETKQIGSQLKFLAVAKGEGIYPRLDHTMKFWDVGAGHAIIEGVGGSITRPNNDAISYKSSDVLVGDFIANLEQL